MVKRPRYSWWLTAALVAVLFAVVGVWSLWSAVDQREASEAKVLGGRATVQSEVGVGSVFRASHPGAIMGKDELIEELWGEEYLGGAISIAVYVRKIREKIEENPAKPAYLKTVWGVGYSFEA